MKRENHVAQLAAAQGLQAFVLLAWWSASGYTCHGYPWDLGLITDVLLGLSLLPIIAAFRRGPIIAKTCAMILCLLPAYYVAHSVSYKLPILIYEWQNP